MSFKRDGTSSDWLNTLRKRRVDDLLSEHIPENEVYLMRNGHLSCLVCPARPTFPNAHQLSVHRAGKKHTSSENYLRQQAAELKLELQKRQQSEFLKTGTIDEQFKQNDLLGPSSSGYKRPTPYDPRGQKKTKPGDRKHIVQLHTETNTTQPSELPGSSRSSKITGNSPFQTVDHYRRMLKATKREENFHVKPYVNQKDRTEDETEMAEIRQAIQKNIEDSEKCSVRKVSRKNPWKVKREKVESSPTSTTDSHPANVTEDMNEDTKKYLIATGAGWKRDWAGHWVKDEDAEFDSDDDDEQPPNDATV